MVQERLSANVQGRRTVRESSASLLAGLLFDAEGEPLVPVHSNKGTQRYRYYVSRALQHGTQSPSATGLGFRPDGWSRWSGKNLRRSSLTRSSLHCVVVSQSRQTWRCTILKATIHRQSALRLA